MAKPGTVTGWKLPSDDRALLLERFPLKYENVVADHVTLRVGASPSTPLPRRPEARVVGRADDGSSLECLVVELDGTTARPDGSIYHITWSLGPGRKRRRATTCCETGVGIRCRRRSTSTWSRRASDG